ncbi:ATP-binding protein [Methylophilus sp. TWE2]|uniref:hybrid sensor histidine kinase/response regulator n=1 Tax=Methylophilus sp. TWE2 TaxID=1662285 RepID=UPI000670FC2B|nr:ATP-binding protein [Methylophilus sp. TWE2]AKR42760.1 ATPase [Methylophilus sp. TWE2]
MSTPSTSVLSTEIRAEPIQRIVKIRRDYNNWVANETIEDYALRYTPRAFRKWSILRVSNTALGAISFLVLEAIGGTITINYGFPNAMWAILAVGLMIFLTGLPISYYAAKYGLDMDLLTRGAGFGYIGSTISSFVYASFTFILLSLEAAIMGYALELYFHLPLYLGYLVSALIVIPLVTHGVTLISRIQMITQPIWIALMFLPFLAILKMDPGIFDRLSHFAGISANGGEFNWMLFGAATAVGVALIPQIGEQVDFLRFMPERNKENYWRWNLGVLMAGPGWVILGMLKMFAGALLAYMVFNRDMPLSSAINPTHMYWVGFGHVFSNPEVALAVTALFVCVSQIKVNMTNAYAGSLAWSNFFARLTHSHPGRIVWVVFNVMIAIVLMELNVFQALEEILGLYANIAIAWIAAVVADLVINKPLGLSPKGIEFRRAYLYDINPVGVGAMFVASAVSIVAYTGAMGPLAQSFSTFISLFTALVLSPLIAWGTKGKYYLARPRPKYLQPNATKQCVICEREYEVSDMAHCPAYGGAICSLCCCLDARCHDACKPHGRLSAQWEALNKRILPKQLWPHLNGGVAHFLLLMVIAVLLFGATISLIYLHDALTIGRESPELMHHFRLGYLKVFVAMLFLGGIVAWWLVLTSASRRVAQEESNRQTGLLLEEIESHKKTDAQLQKARRLAEEANQAKSRYITGISHELRTPLNSILGYAQLLTNDDSIPEHRRQAIRTISRGGEHLLSLIESTLDIARIESGKMAFDVKPLHFPEFIGQIVSMFEIQAQNKGLAFYFEQQGHLPEYVRADHKRLMQILVNILGNAVKFTTKGSVTFRVSYAREIAQIDIEDTGPGIAPNEVEKIFEPFERGSAADVVGIGGTGLGLTISKLLTQLMGGEMHFDSVLGRGTRFEIRLFLPQIRETAHLSKKAVRQRIGYEGPIRTILVVDNEQVDRELLRNTLQPLGFIVHEAGNGQACVNQYQMIHADLILMDLAMPVMDGWEAAYIIRQVHHAKLPIAIISANAYDRSLDNQAKIPAQDFFVKPVNLNEVLDWIGNQLGLTWRYADSAENKLLPASTAAESSADGVSLPPIPDVLLENLAQFARMGYVKGVREVLATLNREHSQHQTLINALQQAMERFDFAKLQSLLEEHAK